MSLQIDFRLPESDSLKAKRKVIRSLRDRIRARYPVAVAEVGSQDLRARAELGVAAVGAEGGKLTTVLDAIVRLVESEPGVLVVSMDRQDHGTGEYGQW
ncbi:MAG: DUF503 domain-containing protein [Gemmatimonadota bacterium]|jgi:hypothetical protein|nr:DUF503 domain-containing protein [Gemmatimonadota bacterium]MDP6530030.1 DUF503 domain-containing protein [Gemmatimonadota bacterium]MDP6801817.1 DUF503 domain-containing protein [Gemmatimonadota bacterium]MDP7031543.1 DUF503 domain-containing protein [Gemmatimonadota bacterium]